MNRRSRSFGWSVASVAVLSVVTIAGCPTARDIPPPPQDQPSSAAGEKKPDVPFCGKVFTDPKAPKHNTCCRGPAAGIVKSTDVVTACGAAPAAYLGEARDGDACRLYFRMGTLGGFPNPPAKDSAGGPGHAQPSSGDGQDSWVMLSHPVIATGAPAPVRPDPMLPWRWKKVALRDAIGYQAISALNEPGLLEHQTILWAGRGRRIVGLHVSKQLCNETQAQALLQRAIDAVP